MKRPVGAPPGPPKIRWEDCSIGFECPRCKAELTAFDGDWQECDCGLDYRLVTKIEVK